MTGLTSNIQQVALTGSHLQLESIPPPSPTIHYNIQFVTRYPHFHLKYSPNPTLLFVMGDISSHQALFSLTAVYPQTPNVNFCKDMYVPRL